MAQLSRMKKYQDLRNRLEEETTETSSQVKKEFSRSGKNTTDQAGHARTPERPHDNTKVTPMTNQIPGSPLVDDLIDEVKQYNLDNGNLVSDDTQINILKQLDGTQLKYRNNHFVPLEEDEEELGSTMKLPVSEIEEAFPDEVPKVEKEEMEYYEEPAIDNGPDILPISENPTPVEPIEEMPVAEDDYFAVEETPQEAVEETPVVEEDYFAVEETTEEPVQEEVAEEQPMEEPDVDTKETIVLTHEDFVEAGQDELTSEEELDLYFAEEDAQEEEEPVAQPVKKKKEKKKTAMPSEKKKEQVKTKQAKTAQQRSSMFLNILLAIMIIALIIAIGVTVYYIKQLG